MDSETRRVLSTAKGKLAERWDGGRYCILNAVADAHRDLFPDRPSFKALEASHACFAELGFTTMLDGWRWNDSHTKAEVIALFDRTLLETSDAQAEPAARQNVTTEPVGDSEKVVSYA